MKRVTGFFITICRWLLLIKRKEFCFCIANKNSLCGQLNTTCDAQQHTSERCERLGAHGEFMLRVEEAVIEIEFGQQMGDTHNKD